MSTRLANAPAQRIILALTFSLIACAGVGLAVGSGGERQAFEAFGAAKRFGLPMAYLIFAIVVFWPYNGPYPRAKKPRWWKLLFALLALSSLLSLLIPRQAIGFLNFAQGAALVGGLLLVSWAGLAAKEWEPRQQYRLVHTLAWAAVIATLFKVPLGPFVSIAVPTAAGLLYAAARLRKGRLFFLLAGGYLAWSAVPAVLGKDASIAVKAQVAVGAAMLVMFLFGRTWRVVATVAGALVASVLFMLSDIPTLMRGTVPPDETDVTLTHRAYEADTVEKLLGGNFFSLMFGMGPAATVDLSGSPDRSTLMASGRDIAAVDDVHFLTSWLLMKFGILGLIWMITLLVSAVTETLHILRQRRPLVFESFLLIFVWSGIVSAIPAATNFFANPLPALFLGILIARRRSALAAKQRGPAMVLQGQSG